MILLLRGFSEGVCSSLFYTLKHVEGLVAVAWFATFITLRHKLDGLVALLLVCGPSMVPVRSCRAAISYSGLQEQTLPLLCCGQNAFSSPFLEFAHVCTYDSGWAIF